MTNAPDIFLIAHPRSGTHALTSKISQRPDVFVFGEVFNGSPESEIYPANYFHFLRAIEDTPLASPKNAETRFNSYMTYLKGRARNLRFLVDIKYDTLHLLDSELRDIAGPPSIFAFLSKRGVPIVHLKRNVLHIYFSVLNAAAANQWQVATHEHVQRQTLQIDIEHMMDFVTKKTFEQQEVSRHVRGTDSFIEVWYENLYGPGGAGAFQHLSTFLGIENLAGEESTVKKQIDRPYRELISNFEEVEKVITRSPLAHLLDERPPSEQPLPSLIDARR